MGVSALLAVSCGKVESLWLKVEHLRGKVESFAVNVEQFRQKVEVGNFIRSFLYESRIFSTKSRTFARESGKFCC